MRKKEARVHFNKEAILDDKNKRCRLLIEHLDKSNE